MNPHDVAELRGVALQRSVEGAPATEAAVSLLVRAGLLDSLAVALLATDDGRVEVDWGAAQHKAQSLPADRRALVLIARALAGGFGHLIDSLDDHGQELAFDAMRHALGR